MMGNKYKIKWWEPVIGKEEYKFIKQSLDSSFPNEGPLTTLFEQKICKLVGCKYAVALTNATSAMSLSLKALGIGYGDEVIVPDMTFIATANAVEMCGAKPVLVDVDPKTLTMDTSAFEEAMTEKTKAVIPVHVCGRAADMDKIIDISKKNNLYVIEDAAEALMSRHKGKYLGTFGKTGCFSFSPHKIITTGQGGMVITDDHEVYIRLCELKDQGRPKRGTGGDDIHDVIGYNFKFTDLQAAVGLGQLTYLKSRMDRTKRIYKLYTENLQDADGITLFKFNLEEGEQPLWTDAIVEKRDELDKYLLSNGIESRRFWFPLHTQKPYKLDDSRFPSSISLSKKALWLPSAYTLSDDDIISVCDHIQEFMKNEKKKN